MTEAYIVAPADHLAILNDPLLDRHEVQKWTGIKRSTLYDMMKAGKFPRPLEISEQVKRWPLSDLIAWRGTLQRTKTNP
jgi:prophage regulatory protein